jgi:transposase
MISAEQNATILRLYHAEKWPVGTIARQLGVHHGTVRRALARSGLEQVVRRRRPSKLDPFLPFVTRTLEEYPSLPASRLFEMARERGYQGSPHHFRHLVALYRLRPVAEAYLRLRTSVGEQAQADWAHFGKLKVGKAERSLMAFVMVLSWSRTVFLRFFLGSNLENFLRGHEAAFRAWGGTSRVVLYDNLKSAVLERRGDAIRFHPILLAFAGHYRYEPRPVAVARGNEKGRVERSISFIRKSFFPARRFSDLDDLNAQAAQWCSGIAADRRCPEQTALSVREAFAQERESLVPLPETPFPTEESCPVMVGKTPYVRFDGNDYSVPHTLVKRTLVVVADLDQVRILDGPQVVALHRRSYSRREQIEEPTHLEALTAAKRAARDHRGLDRLQQEVPRSQQLFRLLAQRGEKLGSATKELLDLLSLYGPVKLDQAMAEALAKDSPHPQTVRLILERQLPLPFLPVSLPEDPRVRDLVVRPHDLASYDDLSGDDEDNGDDNTNR